MYGQDTLSTAPVADSLHRPLSAADSVGTAAGDSVAVLPAADSAAVRALPATPQAVYGAHARLVAPPGRAAESNLRTEPVPLFEGFLALGMVCLFFACSRYVRAFCATLVAGLFNYQTSEKQFKDNALSTVITGRVLMVVSPVSVSFFGWLLWRHGSMVGRSTATPLTGFLLICGSVAAYLFVKWVLLKIIDYVGKSAPLMHLVIHFGRLSIFAAGLALLPVSLLMTASESETLQHALSLAGLLIVAVCLLLYIIRVIQTFFTARVSGFFLFLYLCTLELAPFWVLYSLM